MNQKVLVNKISIRQAAMLKGIKQNIQTDLTELQKEGDFLSYLPAMQQVNSKDDNALLSKLLSLKKETLKLNAQLIVNNAKGECVVSTDKCQVNTNNTLIITHTIHGPFNKKNNGSFEIILPLQTLSYYFPKQSDAQWSITYGDERIVSSNTQVTHSEENILISEPFTIPLLKGYALNVMIERSALVDSLDDARKKTFIAAIIGLLIILAMAYYLSRYFSLSLTNMSKLVTKIVNNGSYSLRSNLTRTDEIGILSRNIDTLLQTTEELFAKLAQESELRLKRFTALIGIFNAITKSSNDAEIDTLVKQCLSDDFFAKSPEQYDLFIQAVLRMARLQKEQLLLQESQLRLLEETSEALQIKSAFISQISHEFRTPLNSIIGFSQFIEQEKLLNEPYSHLAKNIEKAGKYLLDMINQLLELAKNESLPLQADIQPLNLPSLCNEVIELLYPLAKKSATQLCYKNPDLSYTVKADERMLRQVLFNLIGNAIKFSPQATVTVEIRYNALGTMVETIVHDTGIGMDAQEISKVFMPFQRLSNSVDFKGTGLGLSLAKAYTENMHGTIHVESTGVGLGSTFIVAIPAMQKEE